MSKKITGIWFDFYAKDRITMEVSASFFREIFKKPDFEIFPANAPSALRFYKAYSNGEPLNTDDARQVKAAAIAEGPGESWKIVEMKVEPMDGTDFLSITLRSGDVDIYETIWPPRAPSARLFLQAFQNGKELYDKDLRLLKKFVSAEADQVGLVQNIDRGILEWNPEWDDYL